MSILKELRKNKALNGLIRKLLKRSSKSSARMHTFLMRKWKTAGVLDCNFGAYKFKYFNQCDDGLAGYFYYDFPYREKADLSLFIELAKSAKTIVDIGANTGLYSVLAGIANAKATIHAIEPYSVNAARMRVNMELNGLKNITINEVAIGETDGELQLSVPKNKSVTDVSSLNGEFSKEIYPELLWDNQTVKIQTLDNFATEKNMRINLIKCDVETLEMSVFKGADRVLREDKPIIIFECFLDEERKLFFNDILAKYDYYVYLILEEGLVYIKEGFVASPSAINYLIVPVAPSKTFLDYKDMEYIRKEFIQDPGILHNA